MNQRQSTLTRTLENDDNKSRENLVDDTSTTELNKLPAISKNNSRVSPSDNTKLTDRVKSNDARKSSIAKKKDLKNSTKSIMSKSQVRKLEKSKKEPFNDKFVTKGRNAKPEQFLKKITQKVRLDSLLKVVDTTKDNQQIDYTSCLLEVTNDQCKVLYHDKNYIFQIWQNGVMLFSQGFSHKFDIVNSFHDYLLFITSKDDEVHPDMIFIIDIKKKQRQIIKNFSDQTLFKNIGIGGQFLFLASDKTILTAKIKKEDFRSLNDNLINLNHRSDAVYIPKEDIFSKPKPKSAHRILQFYDIYDCWNQGYIPIVLESKNLNQVQYSKLVYKERTPNQIVSRSRTKRLKYDEGTLSDSEVDETDSDGEEHDMEFSAGKMSYKYKSMSIVADRNEQQQARFNNHHRILKYRQVILSDGTQFGVALHSNGDIDFYWNQRRVATNQEHESFKDFRLSFKSIFLKYSSIQMKDDQEIDLEEFDTDQSENEEEKEIPIYQIYLDWGSKISTKVMKLSQLNSDEDFKALRIQKIKFDAKIFSSFCQIKNYFFVSHGNLVSVWDSFKKGESKWIHHFNFIEDQVDPNDYIVNIHRFEHNGEREFTYDLCVLFNSGQLFTIKVDKMVYHDQDTTEIKALPWKHEPKDHSLHFSNIKNACFDEEYYKMKYFIQNDSHGRATLKVFNDGTVYDFTDKISSEISMINFTGAQSSYWEGLKECTVIPLFTKLPNSMFILLQQGNGQNKIYFFELFFTKDEKLDVRILEDPDKDENEEEDDQKILPIDLDDDLFIDQNISKLNIHSAIGGNLDKQLVLFDERNIYIVDINTGQMIHTFHNQFINNMQFIDDRYIYFLKYNNLTHEEGFFLIDYENLINHRINPIFLSRAITGINTNIDFDYDNQRIIIMKNYQKVNIFPPLHRNVIHFVGMGKRSNYLTFQKYYDTFKALDKTTMSLNTWSLISGQPGYTQRVQEDQIKELENVEIYMSHKDDLNYQREFYHKEGDSHHENTLVIDPRHIKKENMSNYPEIIDYQNGRRFESSLRKVVGNQRHEKLIEQDEETKVYECSVNKYSSSFNEFKILQIKTQQHPQTGEYQSNLEIAGKFVHQVIQCKPRTWQRIVKFRNGDIVQDYQQNTDHGEWTRQKLFLNYKCTRMLEVLQNELAIIYERDFQNETRSEGEVPIMKWKYLTHLDQVPRRLMALSDQNFVFSPDFGAYLDYDGISGLMRIHNTITDSVDQIFPKSFISLRKNHEVEDAVTFARGFQWTKEPEFAQQQYSTHVDMKNKTITDKRIQKSQFSVINRDGIYKECELLTNKQKFKVANILNLTHLKDLDPDDKKRIEFEQSQKTILENTDIIKELSTVAIPLFDQYGQNSKQFFYTPEPLAIEDTKTRLIRNYQYVKIMSSFQSFELKDIYNQCFEVDFGITYRAHKFAADLCFTYVDWLIIKQFEDPQTTMNLRDLQPSFVNKLMFNILPGCETMLHKCIFFQEQMTQIIDVCDSSIPFIKNVIESTDDKGNKVQKKHSPLDLCFKKNYLVNKKRRYDGSLVIANMLLDWLKDAPLNHHTYEIRDIFPKLIKLPSFGEYVEAREFQPQQLQDIKREKFDAGKRKTIGLGVGNLWNDTQKRFSAIHSYNPKRQDKVAVDIKLLDIPDVFSFDEHMIEFYDNLGKCKNLDIFDSSGLKRVLDYQWSIQEPLMKNFIYKPYCFYVLLFFLCSNFAIPYRQALDNDDNLMDLDKANFRLLNASLDQDLLLHQVISPGQRLLQDEIIEDSLSTLEGEDASLQDQVNQLENDVVQLQDEAQDVVSDSESWSNRQIFDFILIYGISCPLFFLSVYFFYNEMRQAVLLDLKSYVSDPMNFLDILPSLTVMATSVNTIIYNSSHPVFIYLNIIAATSIWLKFIFFLRIFRKFGYFIRMVKQVIIDMKVFLVINLFFIFCFTDSFYTISLTNKYVDPDLMFVENYEQSWIYTFLAALGEWDYDTFYDQKFSGLVWVLFIICIIVNQVVMMNLLIAVISKTFDDVNDINTQATYAEIASLINESIFLIDKEQRSKMKAEMVFLLVVSKVKNSKENAEGDADQEGEEEEMTQKIDEKFQKMDEKIQEVKNSVDKKLDEIKKSIEMMTLSLQKHKKGGVASSKFSQSGRPFHKRGGGAGLGFNSRSPKDAEGGFSLKNPAKFLGVPQIKEEDDNM